MSASKPSMPVSPRQITAVLASALAAFFVMAFATKSLDAYRLRNWRERLNDDIAQMEIRRASLEEELRRRQSISWVEEVLRDAGQLPEGVVSVAAIAVTPNPAAARTPAPVSVATPPPLPSDTFFDNPHWRAWQRLILGFD